MSLETTPVFAGTPTITNVVVWNNGGNTTLNVTVSHSPETFLHHVDSIEVNISGTIDTTPVPVQPTTEFTIVCDLGPISGAPFATVRAHCIVDDWGPLYGPIQVPELSFPVLLLTLIFATALSTAAYHKVKSRNHKNQFFCLTSE
jgi:hypothetical protein